MTTLPVLRERLPAETHPDLAPSCYGEQEAEAWADGYNSARADFAPAFAEARREERGRLAAIYMKEHYRMFSGVEIAAQIRALPDTPSAGDRPLGEEAIELLDQFDRFNVDEPLYLASPFSRRVRAFLTRAGKRPIQSAGDR